MCGIAGFLSSQDQALPTWVPELGDRLAHRGPDDAGWLGYSPDGIETGHNWSGHHNGHKLFLFHRRLSIIDLSSNGWQPMASHDGRLHVVYNGEIYNYLELREELRKLGHCFRTQSDTEVLLAAYSEWGPGALRRFEGMFSFALLDTHRKVLVLARDFFGIKPLYYVAGSDFLAFASEIKALLGSGAVRPQGNPERLYEYLRYGISDDGTQTMLADVKQLPAGHYLEIALDRPMELKPVRYWQPNVQEQTYIGFAEAARRLRELFLKNVRRHLRSDVPVGVALSGGIDSSSILAAMREVAPDLDLHAFSYIADEVEISEERWIELAAGSSAATLHKVRPRAGDLRQDLETLICAQDQPFGSTSLYAQYCVFRAAREAGIKVMLDGQGADEILGGYRFHTAARFASLLKQGKWTQAMQFASRCSTLPGVSRQWLLSKAAEYLLPSWIQGPLRKSVGKELWPAWLEAKWFHERGVHPAALHGSESQQVLREYLGRSLAKNTLPGLLRYEDRNSMAFSIESRVPFLTPELVEFVLSLPEEYIVAPDGTSKAVFRQAMRGLTQDAILDRRDKIGFATPEESWLRKLHHWVGRVLNGETAAALPCLHGQQMSREWEEIVARRKPFTGYVWRWLNLILWTERLNVQWS
jgi:asparagine synthase (glutamine-hydrolysing)